MKIPPHKEVSTPSAGASAAARCEPGVCAVPRSNCAGLTIVAVLLIPITYLLLWRTSFGLRLRSCGENPAAADSLGVPVYRYKYIGVLISGALAGLGKSLLASGRHVAA